MKRILTTFLEKWPEYIIEAIVIITSILGAYALDNYNENRKERIQEIKYLKNLRLDLEADLINLDSMIADRTKKVDGSIALLEMNPPKTQEEFRSYNDIIWDVFVWSSFTPRTNTIDELISSGNLSILSSDSVKFYILNIKQMNADIVKHREHMRREYEHYLYDNSNSIQPVVIGINLKATHEQGKFVLQSLTPEQLKVLHKQTRTFLSSLSVRNGLTLAFGNNGGMIKHYTKMMAEIELLLEQIDLSLAE